MVGRFTRQKNIPLILEALEGTDIVIDLVGDGEEREQIRDNASHHGVLVNFLGRLPNNEMPKLFHRYYLYVTCSRFEGNPKSLLEAMACGCAVIGTDVVGIRDVIRDNVSGRLVCENSDQLRSSILNLLSDVRTMEKLGIAARKQVLIENSFEVAIEKELNTYYNLSA